MVGMHEMVLNSNEKTLKALALTMSRMNLHILLLRRCRMRQNWLHVRLLVVACYANIFSLIGLYSLQSLPRPRSEVNSGTMYSSLSYWLCLDVLFSTLIVQLSNFSVHLYTLILSYPHFPLFDARYITGFSWVLQQLCHRLPPCAHFHLSRLYEGLIRQD